MFRGREALNGVGRCLPGFSGLKGVGCLSMGRSWRRVKGGACRG